MKKLVMVFAFISALSMLAVASSDGESLYLRCKGCHGASGEKHALGTSELLQKQSAADIEKKLNGYKNGTFGGEKKSVMESQAKRLSESDIKTLAEYISKF